MLDQAYPWRQHRVLKRVGSVSIVFLFLTIAFVLFEQIDLRSRGFHLLVVVWAGHADGYPRGQMSSMRLAVLRRGQRIWADDYKMPCAKKSAIQTRPYQMTDNAF